MSTHVKAVILILILGLGAIFATRLILPMIRDSQQRQTSDASATKGTLLVGMDSWVGYFPLCSKPMTTRMRQAGYVLRCDNDNGDYGARMKRLKSGDLQFAVASVDSYLQNGAGLGFPGTLIAVIDESKGGDALVARAQVAASIDQLRQAEGARVAFTPGSASEQLLRALGVHFAIPFLKEPKGRWRLETQGSAEALAKLQSGEAGVAVLWEPDVSRALANSDLVKLMGTDDTEGLIVDVLLVGRKFAQDHPDAVATLLENYFQVEKQFRERPEDLVAEVVDATQLSRTQVQAMLRGVSWTTLVENGALWLGEAGSERLVESIQSAVAILRETGALSSDPLPDGDPYRLTNRQFIADLYRKAGGTAKQDQGRVPPLDEAGWRRLKEVGTLDVQPIAFQSGTADLTYEGKEELDRVAERLKHYPRFRILVKGHTGTRGDAGANLALSQERAETVTRYLLVTHGLDPNRLRSLGYGGERPPARKPGETDRAYAYRQPRVELVLAAENL